VNQETLLSTSACARALGIHPKTLLEHIPAGTVALARDYWKVGLGKLRPTYRWDVAATRAALSTNQKEA
jgi:hypothetical protein